MAERKILALYETGDDTFPEEIDVASDSITVAALTIHASGTGITMNSKKITGLGDATTAGDALAFGQNAAELGTTSFTGDVDAGGNQIGNVGDPLGPEDAANKQYVDAVVAGLDPHESVVAKTAAELTSYVAAGTGVGKTLEAPDSGTGHNTIDGVLLAVNDRVLVSMQGGDDATADVDNGVYDVTTLGDGASAKFKLTRVTDADQATSGEMAQGLYVFCTGGTSYTNTGWNQTLEVTTMETSTIKFSQFSGAPGYQFNQGLKKEVNTITVELDTDADAAGTGAAGGTSGLEFDADTAAGQLRVKVDPAAAITRNANGIGVNLDGTTLQLDAGGAGTGISVKGLPTQFEIGGSAVGTNVTQTNMDIVFGGVASDADSMHTHNGLASSVHSHAHSATTGQTADDHHNQQHAIDSASDHSLAGGTAGYVLRASGTTTFAWAQLDHSDLAGVDADDHHNQQHTLSGSDHTETGLTSGHVLTATGATTFAWQAPGLAEEATRVEDDYAVDEAVAAGDPLYWTATGDRVGKALASNISKSWVTGIAVSAQSTVGQTTNMVTTGKATGVLGGGGSNGARYWLQGAGGIGTTKPTTGQRLILMGVGMNANDLFVNMIDFGKRA